jgi:hypothetical protein
MSSSYAKMTSRFKQMARNVEHQPVLNFHSGAARGCAWHFHHTEIILPRRPFFFIVGA